MAASRSAEPAPGPGTGPHRRRLSPAERVVGAGAIAVAVSVLLPWYGIPFANGLAVTGIDNFGFAEAALLLTVGAVAFVIARSAAGRPIGPPLRPWALVMAAGAWAALLVVALMIDRPEELGGSIRVGLRMGIFVALGGCVAIVVGAMRMRAEAR